MDTMLLALEGLQSVPVEIQMHVLLSPIGMLLTITAAPFRGQTGQDRSPRLRTPSATTKV